MLGRAPGTEHDDTLLDIGAQPYLDLVGEERISRHDDFEGLAGDHRGLVRGEQPLGVRGLAHGGLQQQAGEEAPQAALQSWAPAKRSSRNSTNRRTFAERCLRLGYTA